MDERLYFSSFILSLCHVHFDVLSLSVVPHYTCKNLIFYNQVEKVNKHVNIFKYIILQWCLQWFVYKNTYYVIMTIIILSAE